VRLILEAKCSAGAFGLGPLRAGFRPLSRRKGRVGTRPIATSIVPIGNVRLTSKPVQLIDGVDAPLLTASQCAKVAMFAHPTNEEGIHGKS
jgi:hypothetical protein